MEPTSTPPVLSATAVPTPFYPVHELPDGWQRIIAIDPRGARTTIKYQEAHKLLQREETGGPTTVDTPGRAPRENAKRTICHGVEADEWRTIAEATSHSEWALAVHKVIARADTESRAMCVRI